METKTGFTMIPNRVIKNPKITNNIFRTYVAIRSYAYGKNKAFPSQETIAKDLGTNRETINKHVAKLAKLGEIKKRKRGYSQSNVYDFCDDIDTNGISNSDVSVTSIVNNSSTQLLENEHTNNTSNKTTNKGIEILRKKMWELGYNK